MAHLADTPSVKGAMETYNEGQGSLSMTGMWTESASNRPPGRYCRNFLTSCHQSTSYVCTSLQKGSSYSLLHCILLRGKCLSFFAVLVLGFNSSSGSLKFRTFSFGFTGWSLPLTQPVVVDLIMRSMIPVLRLIQEVERDNKSAVFMAEMPQIQLLKCEYLLVFLVLSNADVEYIWVLEY